MKNSIDVYVEFSFKGEAYRPSLTVDLDHFVEHGNSLEAFHRVLAEVNGIDTYSYLYEVMEQAELHYCNPLGRAVEFLRDGLFDQVGFTQWWRHEGRVEALLQEIAERELGVAVLEAQPGLKEALLQSYRLGQAKKE